MCKLALVATLLLAGSVTAMAQQTRDLNLRGDRFAPLTWEQLTPEQKTMVNDLLSGTRGSLGGPFNVTLRSPEMGNLAQKLGEYLRFRTAVPARLNEMAILLTAKWWSARYRMVGASAAGHHGGAERVRGRRHSSRTPSRGDEGRRGRRVRFPLRAAGTPPCERRHL